jgi:hypothetical protein
MIRWHDRRGPGAARRAIRPARGLWPVLLGAGAALLALAPGPGGAAPTRQTAPTAAVDLLRPLPGGAGSGGLPVFLAGPADGMTPDALEPNDRFEQAVAVNVGAVYRQLNFVPAPGTAADGDFYMFRAKPGDCYLVQTGDLAPGLDTTILLWRAAPTREGRRLLAQNDDSRPHSADLGSAVRWCSATDTLVVAEVHNYGWAPPTDPRGKTYSLAAQIDPPTPTPTPRPPAPPAASGDPARAAALAPPPAAASAPAPHAPTPLPAPPPPTPRAPPPLTATATVSPTARVATATATPVIVSVDVVAYVAGADAPGPAPGDGIVDWPVQLIDRQTNAPLQTVTTDGNGHARLSWTWRGPVWVELPTLRWSRLIADPQADPALTGGPLYARKDPYPLPGIWP